MNEIVIDAEHLDIVSRLDNEKKNCVVFKTDNVADVINCLIELNKVEIDNIEKQKTVDIVLNFKDVSVKTRGEVLNWALHNDSIVDSTLILNIFNLIKGFNSYDESFYKVPEVMFNSFEEFIDIKTSLKDTLLEFRRGLAKYFYSILRTVGATVFPDNVRPEIIPLVYQRLFLVSDFISISNMIRNFTDIEGLVFVENAELFLHTLSTRYVFAGILMKKAGVITGDK